MRSQENHACEQILQLSLPGFYAIETCCQACDIAAGARRELFRERSGDIFIAFSTANPAASSGGERQVRMLSNDRINPIFLATVQATEEAVINAMIAAKTMTGIKGRPVMALTHDRLRETLQKYNRISP